MKRDQRGHSEKVAICKLERESSSESNHAGTLILNFQFLALEKKIAAV